MPESPNPSLSAILASRFFQCFRGNQREHDSLCHLVNVALNWLSSSVVPRPKSLRRHFRVTFRQVRPVSGALQGRAGDYDDSDAFCFFLNALRAAQYFFMRADTDRRFASVMNSFPARRLRPGFLSFSGLGDVVCLGGFSEFAGIDGFVVILLAAARFGRAVGAISIPNISERSSLSSTLAPAGPLRVFEMSDPAFAIKSC